MVCGPGGVREEVLLPQGAELGHCVGQVRLPSLDLHAGPHLHNHTVIRRGQWRLSKRAWVEPLTGTREGSPASRKCPRPAPACTACPAHAPSGCTAPPWRSPRSCAWRHVRTSMHATVVVVVVIAVAVAVLLTCCCCCCYCYQPLKLAAAAAETAARRESSTMV